MDEAGKPIAVICHAPWLLVSAGRVEDRILTSYHTIQDDVRNAGGNWVDKEVVVDGNWVSSRQPSDIPAFNREMLKLFKKSGATKKAVQAPEPLPQVQKVPLRFALPGSTRSIQATGEVIWTNHDGRAGMFFSHIAPASRKYLKDWLNKRGVNKQNAVRILMEPQAHRRVAHSSN